MAPKPFPILFITASRIGDAVLSSGLIKTLADEIPGARFTIVASALDRAPVRPHAGPGGADRHGKEAGRRPTGSPCGARFATADGAWWWTCAVRPWPGSCARCAAPSTPRTPPAHKVIEAARLLKLEDSPPAPFLFTTTEIEERAARLTAGAGPILAMAPAANWIGKTWPAERFALVARHLLGPGGPLAGGRLMVLGGPGPAIRAPPSRSRGRFPARAASIWWGARAC